jgi:hypothetical protein
MPCCKNCPDDTAQRLVERMLEDESLTSGLIDDAAAVLLDWGKTRLQALVQQAEGLWQNGLDKAFANLRHTMRDISKQAGKATPEMQIDQVHALLEAQARVETEVEAEEKYPLESTLEEKDHAA